MTPVKPVRKAVWIAPIVIIAVLLVALLAASEFTALQPFFYPK
jgi:hypothetical protein